MIQKNNVLNSARRKFDDVKSSLVNILFYFCNDIRWKFVLQVRFNGKLDHYCHVSFQVGHKLCSIGSGGLLCKT